MEIQFLNSKTEDFINSLDEKARARVDDMIILLSIHSHNLRMPFSKSLGAGLFELRIVGMTHVRVMYTFKYDQAWILHAFIKKTNKIQQKEIGYARNQIKHLQ
jgi:phage-related protein